jgi:hypothetical protein
MGSSRPRNSTRAGKARSDNSSPKPRRKPAPKYSKLRTAAEVLRGLRERQVEATLQVARAAEPARTAAERPPLIPTEAVPATALRQIREKLGLICSCAVVVEHALSEQNCELDDDAALVLKRHVGDALFDQILSIDRLLGDSPGEDDEESRP